MRRRSEVDRRLEAMVGPTGKLREMNTNAVVKMLRLFNLCDLGTAAPTSPAGTAKASVNPKSLNPENPPSFFLACILKIVHPIFKIVYFPILSLPWAEMQRLIFPVRALDHSTPQLHVLKAL